ncbi:MAG TPA: MiaB/RimO family radical SAM methylthiotransferase [Acidimicrobiales bacterium]|nr:MiaB/RimO family radical SAM methylthiotransferase [Acidimicrobiales bacterium]
MPRKFYLRTFGCQMNEHDSQRIAADLVADGLERTEALEEADVVVLNTCCIRENADNKLYGNLGHLKALAERKPGLQIAVGGCLAQKDRQLVVERAPHVDVVFGTHNVGRAAALLRDAAASGAPVVEVLDGPPGAAGGPGAGADFPTALPVRSDSPYAAWVTIQTGCDNSCAFCIVPAVRGPEQSRPFGELVGEVEHLARAGTSEVTLLGQNVNSYGRDLTTQLRAAGRAGRSEDEVGALAGAAWAAGERRARPLFADLLRAVGSVEGIRRVRFTSPHPKDLRPETVAAMAETPAVCEQLHLPLQSGSDAVLTAMRRGYTAQRYLGRLAAARAAVDDLAVTTDVIVGFPGESEDDFVRTLEVVAEAGYDSAYTFIFSPRPGTRAAAMTERFVPGEVVAERFARLTAVVERSALARHAARVGRVEEVVVEGPSKKDPGVLTGRTRQGKLVHFPPPDAGRDAPGPARPGDYLEVLVTAAGPHHLVGELVAASPRAGPAGGGVAATACGATAEPGAGRRRIPLTVT